MTDEISPKSLKNPAVCDGIGAFKKHNHISGLNSKEMNEDPTKQSPNNNVFGPINDENFPKRPRPNGTVDWSSLGDMTGTRPNVNRYSISRYSLAEWRKNSKQVLDTSCIAQSNTVDYNAKTSMMKAFGSIDKEQIENEKRLKQKARDIYRWKSEVEMACKAITEEVELLEIERQRLKGAARVLMLPEAISKECLELRTNRLQPDLVADLAEQEMKKEIQLVNEVRATLKTTLDKIEEQMAINKAAKHRIEYDWCDKTMAYNTESINIGLTTKSNTIMFRPGSTRYGDFSAPTEFWDFYCRENILSCEAARQSSSDLRGSLNAILLNGGRKLRIQADKTDMALAHTVSIASELCTQFEETLRYTLRKIADIEILIKNLQDAISKMDAAMKLAQTRLENRNIYRPRGDSVRDLPHFGLMGEVKKIHENVSTLLEELKNAERARASLMQKRIELERNIAAKRKSLNIDRDRCGMIRSHYPSALELAGY